MKYVMKYAIVIKFRNGSDMRDLADEYGITYLDVQQIIREYMIKMDNNRILYGALDAPTAEEEVGQTQQSTIE